MSSHSFAHTLMDETGYCAGGRWRGLFQERRAVSESGGSASLAGRAGRVEKPKRARRRKPDTAKADLEPVARNIPEVRVSGAIRNPKGMRRSIGLQSMGATPKTNRSAKDGARSSPHYGGEGVSHSPIAPRCLLAARYGRFECDPRRPACVPAASRVSTSGSYV